MGLTTPQASPPENSRAINGVGSLAPVIKCILEVVMKPLYLIRFVQEDTCYIPQAYRSLFWAKTLASRWERYGWKGAEVVDATDIDFSEWKVVAKYGL